MLVLAETSWHAKPWKDAKAAIASFTASLMCFSSKTFSQLCKKQHLSTTEVVDIITGVSGFW